MTYSGGTPRKEADVRGALMGTPLYLGGGRCFVLLKFSFVLNHIMPI